MAVVLCYQCDFVLDGIYEGSAHTVNALLRLSLDLLLLSRSLAPCVVCCLSFSRRSYLHSTGCVLIRTLSDGLLFLTQHDATASASAPTTASMSPSMSAGYPLQIFRRVHSECVRLLAVQRCLGTVVEDIELVHLQAAGIASSERSW